MYSITFPVDKRIDSWGRFRGKGFGLIYGLLGGVTGAREAFRAWTEELIFDRTES